MDERRLSKVARLIQRELAELFRQDTQANAKGVIISVTTVRPTADLSLCRVFLSIFPSSQAQDLLKSIQ